MKAGDGDSPYSTLLKTELRGQQGFSTELAPNPQTAATDTHWSTVTLTGQGATCNDVDWGTKAAIPSVSYSDEAEGGCTLAVVLETCRTVVVSLLVWSAAWLVMRTSKGSSPLDMDPFLVYLLFAASLVVYIYDLRSRSTFWTVAWPGRGGNSEAFAQRVQMLRDASPVVDLLPPNDATPTSYRIAEWRDETRQVDPEGFAGAPRGLFFVTFPVEIFPGDPSEASALEFARAEVVRTIAGGINAKVVDEEGGRLCEDAEKVGVRSRLLYSDGSSEGQPAPHVLAEGNEAECLRPVLLLSMLCLFGLVADSLLRAMLAPLPWPVRKRIFTLQGDHVGRIRFCVSMTGEVQVDGDEKELRDANKFWLKEQDWRALWAGVKLLGPKAACLRRLRIGTLCVSGIAAVATALLVFLVVWSKQTALVGQVLGTGIAVTVALVAVAGLIGCIAHRSAQNCAESLAEHLGGAASCTAAWAEAGPNMLHISIEQLATEKSAKASTMPIGSHKKVSES